MRSMKFSCKFDKALRSPQEDLHCDYVPLPHSLLHQPALPVPDQRSAVPASIRSEASDDGKAKVRDSVKRCRDTISVSFVQRRLWGLRSRLASLDPCNFEATPFNGLGQVSCAFSSVSHSNTLFDKNILFQRSGLIAHLFERIPTPTDGSTR